MNQAESKHGRLKLAGRRILWFIGAVPIGAVALVLGSCGAALAMCLMLVLWLSGSTKVENDHTDALMFGGFAIWDAWDRLRIATIEPKENSWTD